MPGGMLAFSHVRKPIVTALVVWEALKPEFVVVCHSFFTYCGLCYQAAGLCSAFPWVCQTQPFRQGATSCLFIWNQIPKLWDFCTDIVQVKHPDCGLFLLGDPAGEMDHIGFSNWLQVSLQRHMNSVVHAFTWQETATPWQVHCFKFKTALFIQTGFSGIKPCILFCILCRQDKRQWHPWWSPEHALRPMVMARLSQAGWWGQQMQASASWPTSGLGTGTSGPVAHCLLGCSF